MAENYKIQLGINFNDNELKNVKKQLTSLTENKHRIRIDIDNSRLLKQVAHAKKELMGLRGLSDSNGGAPSLNINTKSVETALNRVANSIDEIKISLSTLDGKSGMQSVVTSVNQIASALGKATDESETLIKTLSNLGKKDFSLNIGLNVGGSNNPIARNAAYGNKVRSETLPQLKQQAESLVKYVNDYYKTSYNEFEALQKLVQGTKLGTGDFYQDFLFGKDSVASRMSGGSLSGQMQAFKQYIDMFKQAASLKGISLDSVTSQFSKSADELVKDAQDIQTGAKEAKEGVEQLKGIFGASIDAESLSAQLTPIVKKLEEIKVSINSLANAESLGGLTTSFDRLSNTLEILLNNAKLAQDVLGTGLSGARGATGSGVSNVVNGFKEANIQINATEDKIDGFSNALKSIGINDSSVESITQKFKELGVTVTNVTSKLNSDGSVIKLSIKGFDESKNIVTAVNSLNKDGLLSGWTTTVSKNSKEIENGFVRLKSLAKEISNLKIDIFKSNDADEVEIMTSKLNALQAEYKELHAQVGSGLSGGQEAQLSATFEKTEETLLRLRKSHSETQAEFAKRIELNLKTGEFKTQIIGIEQDAKRLSGTYKEVDASIDRLNQALTNMRTASAEGDVDSLVRSYKEYEAILKTVKNQIDQNSIAEKNATNLSKLNQQKQSLSLEMKNWLRDNSAAAKDFGARIRELEMQIDACDDSSLGNLRREFQNIKKEAQLAGKTTKTVGDRIKEQFMQYSTYLGVSQMFMWAQRGLRDMFEQVKLIDAAMTELKKVTNETDATYNKFLTNAGSRAKEIGTTIDGLVNSTADFARLGYEFSEAQGLAEVANIYAVVGDDIDSVESATQSLISTLTAFKDEAGDLKDSDFALSIVDKMNEVSNNFAISSGGLGDALQRSASSMMAANNSLDETIALITAANTVVQDPDSVGTAFKTISMRIKIHCPQ